MIRARWAIFLLLLPTPAMAYDDLRAVENLREDFADCLTYYRYVLQEAKSANSPDLIKSTQMMIEATTTIYVNLSVDPSSKKMIANLDRHAMNFQKIYQEEGMDRLMVTYADFCKMLLKNPTPRMEYWKAKN